MLTALYPFPLALCLRKGRENGKGLSTTATTPNDYSILPLPTPNKTKKLKMDVGNYRLECNNSNFNGLVIYTFYTKSFSNVAMISKYQQGLFSIYYKKLYVILDLCLKFGSAPT